MSNINCPLCGESFTSHDCEHGFFDIFNEIDRLHAELKKADEEILNLTAAEAHTAYERDEAREWAKIMYRNYLDTFMNGLDYDYIAK